jgi:hypothetical protein
VRRVAEWGAAGEASGEVMRVAALRELEKLKLGLG